MGGEFADFGLGRRTHGVDGSVMTGNVIPDPDSAIGADGELMVAGGGFAGKRFDFRFDFDCLVLHILFFLFRLGLLARAHLLIQYLSG